jgi:hypothetical protein
LYRAIVDSIRVVVDDEPLFEWFPNWHGPAIPWFALGPTAYKTRATSCDGVAVHCIKVVIMEDIDVEEKGEVFHVRKGV